MTQPTTIKFSKLRVLLGDGATPEVFSAPCGFTERSFVRSKALNEVILADCDNEDLAPAVGRDVASVDWSVSGQGVLAAESVVVWDRFVEQTTSKNVRIELIFPSPLGTLTYTGAAHLESFEVTGSVGNRVTASVNIVADGVLTRSPALT